MTGLRASADAQRDATDATAADLLLDFARDGDVEAFVLRGNRHGVENCRHLVFRKFDVKRGADDLRNLADVGFGCGRGCHELNSNNCELVELIVL